MEQKEKELQPQTCAYTLEEIAGILQIRRSSHMPWSRKGTSRVYALAQPSGSPGSPLTSGWINWNCNAEERVMAKPWRAPLRYNQNLCLKINSNFFRRITSLHDIIAI